MCYYLDILAWSSKHLSITFVALCFWVIFSSLGSTCSLSIHESDWEHAKYFLWKMI